MLRVCGRLYALCVEEQARVFCICKVNTIGKGARIGEVTVKATKVKMVVAGDTIVIMLMLSTLQREHAGRTNQQVARRTTDQRWAKYSSMASISKVF